MHASCHDPQNALVEEVCYPALPCKLAVHDPQNALVEEEGVLSLRCHACKLL
jgi:hypothetical protein